MLLSFLLQHGTSLTNVCRWFHGQDIASQSSLNTVEEYIWTNRKPLATALTLSASVVSNEVASPLCRGCDS